MLNVQIEADRRDDRNRSSPDLRQDRELPDEGEDPRPDVRRDARPCSRAALFAEFETTIRILGERFWQRRERYYEALRLKERADIDGSEPDRRITQWWLTVTWQAWHDAREELESVKATEQRWAARAAKEKKDELEDLRRMELV